MEKETDAVTARIATELRVARERLDGRRLTNAALAKEIGISQMAVGRYMSGERAIPVPTFLLMCAALRVNPGSILEAAGK